MLGWHTFVTSVQHSSSFHHYSSIFFRFVCELAKIQNNDRPRYSSNLVRLGCFDKLGSPGDLGHCIKMSGFWSCQFTTVRPKSRRKSTAPAWPFSSPTRYGTVHHCSSLRFYFYFMVRACCSVRSVQEGKRFAPFSFPTPGISHYYYISIGRVPF